MENIKAIYKGNLRTEAVHLQSGSTIITDAPTDNQGKGEAFSPTDLLATSLGSCMLTTMGILADRLGLNIEGSTVGTQKIMANDPRRVGEIVIDLKIPDRAFDDKTKKMLTHAAHSCPVARSLSSELKQTVRISFI